MGLFLSGYVGKSGFELTHDDILGNLSSFGTALLLNGYFTGDNL